MFAKLLELLINDGVFIGIGAIVALTIEHGWGWVLAQYHARTAAAEAQAKTIFDEITGQVQAAVKPIAADVEAIKAAVAGLQTKTPPTPPTS